jgi:hypothetical protein
MWKQRAVSLCSCIALLPLIVACTGGPGSPPQAYAPPAPSSPPSFAAIQTGLTPRYAAPAAEAAALPYQAAGVPAGPGGVYTVAARTSPGAIIVMLPGAGAVFPTDPALWAAQGFDVVAPPPGPAIPQHRPRLIETSVPAAPGHAPRVIEADAGGQLATPAQQQATVRQIADLIKSAPPG